MLRPRSRALAHTVAIAIAALLAACDRTDDRPPEQIWNEVCATCHAADGAGRPVKLGKSIDMRSERWQRSITDHEIEDRIRNGKTGMKRMPPFGDRFSDEQIDGLVEYIRNELPR